MDQSQTAISRKPTVRRLLPGLVVVLIATAGLALTSSPSGADGGTTVSTGYETAGVSDLIWATEHLGYASPADLQKAGVQVIHYILAGLSGMTADQCALGLGSMIETNGPYSYTSIWTVEEEVALDWVADHYCITDSQAQSYGGTILTFLAGLDAGRNGTSAVRRNPPATTTTTTAAPATTTTTTAAPATTTTTTAAPATTTTTTAAPALYDRAMGSLTSGVSRGAALVSGQRDGYTFTAEAGSKITINLTSTGDTYGTGTTTDPYVVRNKLDTHLQIYDFQDSLIDENSDNDGTNARLSIYVCSVPGTKTYTVIARDENALSTWGDYTITFDLVAKTSVGVTDCLNRG
jgi:hypothetical protein